MAETDEGLYVEGRLDIENSDVAKEAWRSVKAGRLSLSFGFLVNRARKAADGVRELLAVDLFEVSIVAAPANPAARILSVKAAGNSDAIDQEFEAIRALSNGGYAVGAKASTPATKSNRPIRIASFEC